MTRTWFDLSRIPKRQWRLREQGVHQEGVELSPEGVVYYAEESKPGLGGATAPYGFEEFLAEPGNGFAPADHPAIREIIRILEAARGGAPPSAG